jgi:hypothetical protein
VAAGTVRLGFTAFTGAGQDEPVPLAVATNHDRNH